MKKSELPYLNLDKATSLLLPLEPIEARAHYRFAFRLPNGDEEWLLARLCVVEPDFKHERFRHCIMLRPESGEENRIFVADRCWYYSGKCRVDSWMTPAAARKFKWDLFGQSFNDDRYNRKLARYCLVKEQGQANLLEFGANGWGKIFGAITDPEDSVQDLGHERFIWKEAKRDESHADSDIDFLRLKHINFRRKVRTLWNDQNSQVQYAKRWSELNEAERYKIAFECKQGNWQELKEIAALALKLRISNTKSLSDSEYEWDFVDYGYISVEGAPVLKNDDTLYLWRFAITHAFGTPNVGAEGVKIDYLPLPLWSYISSYKQPEKDIKITSPSMHEILEANLKLVAWTKAHFSTEHAQILMDSLKSFSEGDAQKLYDSFNESNSE